jgi:predicted CxxxxCH...CXXCH cytochrome family protein
MSRHPIDPFLHAAAASILAALVVGCASARTLDPGVQRDAITWKADVAPVLAKSCGSCHGGDGPAGGLRTDDYFQVIARARAGDATSRLLTIQSDPMHAPLASAFAVLRPWVVDDGLAYEESSVHGPGLMNPSDRTFHGTVAAGINWNLQSCATCHGTDFAGGASGVGCASCHTGGLTSCTGCHGQPPATGAHLGHVVTAKLDCSACHAKPAAVTAPGHPHSGPATIRFGAVASTSGATPAYDPSTKTCTGVACHGSEPDTAATLRAPTWTGGAAQAACGTCHGLPPSDHVGTGSACVNCHAAVVDADRHIVDAGKHANGTVDLGPGEGCTSCHGQPPATGAHIAHTQAVHELAAPVACGDCHAVPASVDAPGHLAATPQVEMTGVRATAGGATQPVWDPATGTCRNACHGSAQPGWNAGAPAAACGSCHGIPPATEAHDPGLTLADCVRCHAATVEPGGAIQVGGNHINGVVDVQE